MPFGVYLCVCFIVMMTLHPVKHLREIIPIFIQNCISFRSPAIIKYLIYFLRWVRERKTSRKLLENSLFIFFIETFLVKEN